MNSTHHKFLSFSTGPYQPSARQSRHEEHIQDRPSPQRRGGHHICSPHLLLYALISTFCLLAGDLRVASSLQRFNYVQHTAKEHGKLRWAAKINAIHSTRALSLCLLLSECICRCTSLWGLFVRCECVCVFVHVCVRHPPEL